MAVTKRRISRKDWKIVGEQIKEEHKRRADSAFRKQHEDRWREVDRQLQMEAPQRVGVDGQAIGPGWHSEIELGELSRVSEVITADVMRITFPAERDWFEAHVEIPDVEGPQEPEQTKLDNGYRNLFVQQHLDFGFDQRIELSIKEALHHGSFVAEIDWYEDMMIQEGSKVKKIAAPVWVPHSMWNSFPDDSPRCIAQNMFYMGSMILVSYMPRHKLEMQTGSGWMPANYVDIPDDEHTVGESNKRRKTKDLEIIRYVGDIVIKRSSGSDIFLPNSKMVLANGIPVYWDTNPLPYPPFIYGGYERQDPRDPYYTSPLVKLSGWGKVGTVLANKYLDSVDLNVEPPIVYDASDPAFAKDGGPRIFPGASTGTQGSAEFKQIQIGDPMAALSGLELVLKILERGTGADSIRSGASDQGSDRKTAFEINKTAQGAEVRTVDFIRKLNGALRSYLYIQHELNRRELKEYTFYSDDMDTKDFVRITDKEYKEYPNIRWDVIGAKGILGEEQRMMRTTQVTAFASTNELFAPKLKPTDLLLMMYKDAGLKNPERFVEVGEEVPPEVQQAQQIIQQLQAELQELQKDRDIKIADMETRRAKAEEDAALARDKFETETALKAEELARDYALKVAELRIQAEANEKKLIQDYEAKMSQIQANLLAQLQKQADEFRGTVEKVTEKKDNGSEIIKALKEMKPPVVNVSTGGKKKVTLPGGREATIEEDS